MTIYIPPSAPPQAPAVAPQQPRQFFTPGQPLGAPKAKQPEWAQRAAYQRDRVETAHLIQRTLPRVTAAQPLGVPGPRAMDQSAALRRDVPAPLQLRAQSVPVGAARVPYVPPQVPARTRLDEAAVLDEPLPFFTGFAPGGPPPLPFNQLAALRRDAQAPLQPFSGAVPQAPGAVAFAPLQIPPRARGDDLAILDEVLPGPFTMALPSLIAFRRLQIPAWPRGDDPAILRQALQAFFVPPAVLTLTRLEFAITGEAARFSLELEQRMFTLPDDGRVH